MSKRDQILDADDQEIIDVDMSEFKGWPAKVRLRSLSGGERDYFEEGLTRQVGNQTKPNLKNLRARFVSMCAIDEDEGKNLFSQADIPKLAAKNSRAINRLFDAGRKLSGMTDEDVKEMEEVFENAQSDSSISD